ncbi:hypothetical protein HMPREF3190_01158 [Umbribacter vaginalis]|jgi:hypothetical protein|nr:hypothetical protein HMPREF3190_01158 [Coriobacteriales bacterium DNF00809]
MKFASLPSISQIPKKEFFNFIFSQTDYIPHPYYIIFADVAYTFLQHTYFFRLTIIFTTHGKGLYLIIEK